MCSARGTIVGVAGRRDVLCFSIIFNYFLKAGPAFDARAGTRPCRFSPCFFRPPFFHIDLSSRVHTLPPSTSNLTVSLGVTATNKDNRARRELSLKRLRERATKLLNRFVRFSDPTVCGVSESPRISWNFDPQRSISNDSNNHRPSATSLQPTRKLRYKRYRYQMAYPRIVPRSVRYQNFFRIVENTDHRE